MSKTAQIKPIKGWLLVSRENDTPPFARDKIGPWCICWDGTFPTKKAAMKFAKDNHWQPGYRAVRGQLAALI